MATTLVQMGTEITEIKADTCKKIAKVTVK